MKSGLCTVQCKCDSCAGNTCGNGQVCQVNWTGVVEVYERKASWLSIYFILKV